MEIKKSFVHELMDEVKYFKNGQDAIAETITVFAPTNKILQEISIIEQQMSIANFNSSKMLRESLGDVMFNKLISERDTTAKDEVKESDYESVLSTLYSGGADVMKCFTALKSILTLRVDGKNFAMVDETERMTSSIFDNMTPNDTKALLGKYIINFITASQKSSAK